MYNYPDTLRIRGDCTDMMMRGPVYATREKQTTNNTKCTCENAAGACRENGCEGTPQYSEYPLAIVSSPYQGFNNLFDCPAEAMKHGTLFRGLDLPILDAHGAKGGCCV